jgi:hypothetical protein
MLTLYAGVTTVLVGAQWQNDNIRSALISAVAGSLAASTIQGTTGGTNYFDMAGKKACNVGDVVRVSHSPSFIRNIKLTSCQVNFPDAGFGDVKRHNYWHITMANPWTRYGSYECCKGDALSQVDRVLDGLERRIRDGYPEVWGDPWFRDSRCIINEWATCPLS